MKLRGVLLALLALTMIALGESLHKTATIAPAPEPPAGQSEETRRIVVAKFSIKLGEFAARDEADRFRDKVESEHGLFPLGLVNNGKTHSVVLDTNLEERAEVDEYAARLKSKGLDPEVLDESYAVPTAPLDPVERPQDPDGNFVLWVGNQSFERPTVDITVRLDGKVVASRIFQVHEAHTWIAHKFNLEPGKHTIVVRSIKGESELEQTFDASEVKVGAVVSYQYARDQQQPTFTLSKHNRQFGFL